VVKILHAADLHLDSPMRGLHAYEDAPVEELRMATRRALANLVELAITEEVDLVLLAGDIFDGDWPHYGTGLHFVKEMGRLREAEIPVIMVSGNHDAASKLTRSLPLPDNVTLLGAEAPQTHVLEEIGVAVHGQSYAMPEIRDDLAAAFPGALADLLNVGLLHTAAQGRAGHENYAPCQLETLVSSGYDLWALGHVHAREVLSAEPLILFPGNLQGRNIRETGPKGASLIGLDASGGPVERHVDLDCVRWELIRIDASDVTSTDEVFSSLSAEVRGVAERSGGRLVAAGVVLEGVTGVHAELAADPEGLRYGAISAAVGAVGEQVFVERVRLETRAPRSIAGAGEDAVGELIREIEELSGPGLASAAEALAALDGILPEKARVGFDPASEDQVRALLAELGETLPSRLLKGVSG
jgi:DNA repair exonuclease SbcCD nuclease subunit